MVFGNWEVIGFERSDVRLDGFFDIRERGLLRFALAYAAGQAGAFSNPEPVFSTTNQYLAHVLIVPDFAKGAVLARAVT